MLALVGVLVAGVLVGVLVAVLAAFLLVALHVARPPMYELVSTATGWSPREDDDEPPDGFVACSQDGPLLFMNARRFCDGLLDVADRGATVIAVDASATSGVDSTGLRAFLDTAADLEAHGVEVWIVGPIDRLLGRARRIADDLGSSMPPIVTSLDEARARFDRRSDGAAADPSAPAPDTETR